MITTTRRPAPAPTATLRIPANLPDSAALVTVWNRLPARFRGESLAYVVTPPAKWPKKLQGDPGGYYQGRRWWPWPQVSTVYLSPKYASLKLALHELGHFCFDALTPTEVSAWRVFYEANKSKMTTYARTPNPQADMKNEGFAESLVQALWPRGGLPSDYRPVSNEVVAEVRRVLGIKA